ncbi:MAG: stealth family protein [Bacteroidales bacterium]|nr:stealth family protein [Bacteroidales bacterium]
MDIDLVYSWVDGRDPLFIASKQETMKKLNIPFVETHTGDIRYVEHDELRYSLRSVLKYAPWIRHIYIVTNNQCPKWLRENPKITIVNQNDILPPAEYPTFSSVKIEMYLDKIPGLSEHFIYGCDDFFFGRSVQPSDFFKNGKPIVYLDCHRIPQNTNGKTWIDTVVRAYNLYCTKRKKVRFYSPAHSFDAYTKTLFQKAKEDFPEFEKANQNFFRTGDEIQRIIIQYAMAFDYGCPLKKCHHGQFVIRTIRKIIPFQTYRIMRMDFKKFYRDFLIFKPLTFCVNDLAEKDEADFLRFLQEEFPELSPWEFIENQ